MKKPLSAVIIAKNEARQIADCLRPLLQLADEVLVIDNGSSDATPEIAQKMGARVIRTEWKGYAETKNFGSQQAKHDWILSIDADEVVSEELKQSLLQLNMQKEKMYALDCLTNYCGQWVYHSGWYPDWKVRLYNKKDTKWVGEFVHEHLHLPKGTEIIRLKGKLYHYSYLSEEDHLQRIEHYARLSAMKLLHEGRSASWLKRCFAPAARFIRTFIIKRGFLDGSLGWKLSCKDALLVRRKYELLKELQAKQAQKKNT